MKNVLKMLSLIVVSIFFLVACNDNQSTNSTDDSSDNSTSTSTETIKIGSLHPLTGATAAEGQEMRDAIQLAIDQKNEEGGIKSLDGRKLELIAGDHEDNQEKGNSEVQRMAEAGVVGIIGPYSTVEFTATQEAEKVGVPF